MSASAMLIIILTALIILLLILIGLILRIRRLEDKLADVSAADVATYVDNMREILIESERIAEQLDAGIKEKEAMLEDLSDLVESRISRLRQLTVYESAPSIENLPLGNTPLQNKVYQMLLSGESISSIAAKLGITTQEVEMLIDLAAE